MKHTPNLLAALAAGILVVGTTSTEAAPPLSGAIFTTTVDGTIVNENVRYEAKEDVYLDGGPGPRAPVSAAGLPEGDYYFQVTDPSGKDLLSEDHISCRKIHVNEHGVISNVYEGWNYVYVNGAGGGSWQPVACQHADGVDMDHSELGAITVQLFPYLDTTNEGGVYKVWITPMEDYAGNHSHSFNPCATENKRCLPNGEDWQPGNVHGFIPAASKTDNYKVRKKRNDDRLPPTSELTVRKFHDKNFNGTKDAGEEEITGWMGDVTDPSGVTNMFTTPDMITAAEVGTYRFVEDNLFTSLQTVSRLDGAVYSTSLFPVAFPTVLVNVTSGVEENHEVVYGNVGLGSVKACKVFDKDGDGKAENGEPVIQGWEFVLSGKTGSSPFPVKLDGTAFTPVMGTTGADGCTTFVDLLPGDYTLTEGDGGNDWHTAGPAFVDITIVSTLTTDNSGVIMDLSGSSEERGFANFCTATADFDTKGYWHNKNGLDEIEQTDIDYVNGLAPYKMASSYFDAGDEPFDGMFTNGDPVAAAFNNVDLVPIAGEGTPWAEISHFLVEDNGTGTKPEQLAQQLLAFIFNVQHRLNGDYGAGIKINGGFKTAGDIISDAIAAWLSGSDADITAIKDVLDALNNNNAVEVVPSGPEICPAPVFNG